jgi:hypothetical protein
LAEESKKQEIRKWQMRDLVSHAIDFYRLDDFAGTQDGRETIEKRIRREVKEANARAEGDGGRPRYEFMGNRYVFTEDEARYLIEIRLFDYFIERAPQTHAKQLEFLKSTRAGVEREQGSRADMEAEAQELYLYRGEGQYDVPPAPREEIRIAEMRTMLLLLIEHLFPGSTFNFEAFERDFEASWYLNATLDPVDIETRTQLALLETKLTEPTHYLVPTDTD